MNENNIVSQIQKLVDHIQEDNHQHIINEIQIQLEKSAIPSVPPLSVLECHVIAGIGDAHITNAITIAKKLGITRGGISKIAVRLNNKGLIEANQMEGNKREIFYRLTSLGKTVYDIHSLLHKQTYDNLVNMLNKYSMEEQRVISQFLGELINYI
jgi:DNA-binding MarR family transcriptional regulator